MKIAATVIITLILSGFVLVYDGFIALKISRKVASLHYPVTTGKITSSEVRLLTGGRNQKTYIPVIDYSFEVDGYTFTGAKEFSTLAPWDPTAAQLIAKEHPAGAALQVFYNPARPGESMLSCGAQGSDLMEVLFMTPFNMAMLGCWMWAYSLLRDRFFRPPAAGVKIITDRMLTRVRLPEIGPAVWGLATTAGMAFIFQFMMSFITSSPSVTYALAVNCLVYLGGLYTFAWHWFKVRSGVNDIVIDEPSRTITLPQKFGRKQRITANIADIESLSVKMLKHSNKGSRTWYTYAPTITLHGTPPRAHKLAHWQDKVKANDFTVWMRGQLGLGPN